MTTSTRIGDLLCAAGELEPNGLTRLLKLQEASPARPLGVLAEEHAGVDPAAVEAFRQDAVAFVEDGLEGPARRPAQLVSEGAGLSKQHPLQGVAVAELHALIGALGWRFMGNRSRTSAGGPLLDRLYVAASRVPGAVRLVCVCCGCARAGAAVTAPAGARPARHSAEVGRNRYHAARHQSGHTPTGGPFVALVDER